MATTKQYLTYGGIGLGAIATILIGRKLYRDYQVRKEVRDYSQNIDPYTGKKSSGPESINAPAIADTLAINLGTAFGKMDPRSWTENDQVVYETLLQLPGSAFPAVEREYNQKYGRNLRMDIKKLLDSDLLVKIKYIT